MGIMDQYKKYRFKKYSVSESSKSVDKMEKYIKSGKVDIGDTDTLNAYLDAKMKQYKNNIKYSDILELLDMGITREQLVNHSMFNQVLLKSFTDDLNNFLLHEFAIPYDEILNKMDYVKRIIKNDGINKITESIDIQTYTETLLRTTVDNYRHGKIELDHMAELIKFFKELGYQSFKRDFEFEWLLKHDNRSNCYERQDYYNALGLINSTIVNKLYQYELDYMIQYLHICEEETQYSISTKLEPSTDMAVYWKNQSELLGKDAIKFITQYLYKAGLSLDNFLDTNGIPLESLFNQENVGFPMYEVKQNYDTELVKFLSFNIDKIHGSNKGFIKILSKLSAIDDYKASKMNNILCKFLFDENGISEEFYQNHLFNYFLQNGNDVDFIGQMIELLFIVDPEWQSHFNGMEKQYMIYVSQCPTLAGIFYNQKMFRHKGVEVYLDENGLTKAFYDMCLFQSDALTILSQIDINWKSHFTPAELEYINFANKNPKINDILYTICYFEDARRRAVNLYLDENGLTKQFYDMSLFQLNILEILPQIDINWKSHFTSVELQYIDLVGKNHQIKEILEINSTDEINLYFDENGLTNFGCIKLFDNKQYEVLLSIVDSNFLEKAIGKKKYQYVRFCEKVNYMPIELNDDEIELCFDENGVRIEFYSILFQKGHFEVLNEISLDILKKTLSEKQLKIIDVYGKLHFSIRDIYKQYVLENYEKMDISKITNLGLLINWIVNSNSAELRHISKPLVSQLLYTDNPEEKFHKIEDMYLHVNLPEIGKRFNTFKVLHENNFPESSLISPVLKNKSINGREVIIFSDLVKISLGSNNYSMKMYLENMERGNSLFSKISTGEISYEQLDDREKNVLSTFVANLHTLCNNTRLENKELSEDIMEDIKYFIHTFSVDGSMQYNLLDRITKMFFHFAGFDTFDAIKGYMEQKVKLADKKNRNTSHNQITLEKGDFVKGINSFNYFPNILRDGVLCKEYLGEFASEDGTPLDTDLSRIIVQGRNIEDTLSHTISKKGNYGPIYFVLKNDDRFMITRECSGGKENIASLESNLYKMEAFSTRADDHYGIRTGFATTEIDYIIVEENDPRIGLEIAMNGFYIPVVDETGKVVFTEDDYEFIRSKMCGLSYYGENKYKFSNQLVAPNVLEIVNQLGHSEMDNIKKKDAIYATVEKVISNVGYSLKLKIDNDLTPGSVELLDTGSTDRKTNIPGDGDFDFIMRLDRDLILDSNRLKIVKDELLRAFGKENVTGKELQNGDFRLKNVFINGLDEPVKIDISFIQKTDKMDYSTDMAIKDRLQTIQKQDVQKYNLVIGNIILAKKVLQNGHVYTPSRKDATQGGLGGVGVENWILQNGGSFIEAANNFLKASENQTFEDFRKSYYIWDFGNNYLANEKQIYSHDNFVDHMNEQGYYNMQKVLKNYLRSLVNSDNNALFVSENLEISGKQHN